MNRGQNTGFGLLELMLALLLGAVLTTGLLQVVQASVAAAQLQQQLAALQEDARYALASISEAVRPAGYRPQPWLEQAALPAIGADTRFELGDGGDQLAITRLSDRNCFGSLNTSTDVLGNPHHYLLRERFFVQAGGRLVRNCAYGPPDGALVTQINNLALVEQVERLVLQFAEDSDADSHADRWVRAGQWQDESRLMGVRLCLLLASRDPLLPPRGGRVQMLDRWFSTPADGRLRRTFQAGWLVEARRL